MKNNNIYLVIIMLGLVFGACSLDEDPKYEYFSKAVFDSEITTKAVVDEAYSHLANLYGSSLLKTTISNGTMIARVNTGEETRSAAYNTDPDGNNLKNSYNILYRMIDESNRIIEGVKKSNLSKDFKEEQLGHAYFIRGYAYYLLGSLWGRASLQLTPVGDSESINRPLSSRTDIYTQAEKDLLLAAKNLPETKNIGRADKKVANAYLAKLYFMLASQKQSGIESSNYTNADELWKKTIEYGEKVGGKEFLDPNYANLFGSGVSSSNEIIFQLNYTSSVVKGIRKSWNNLFGPYFYSHYTSVIKGADSYRTVVMDRAFYDYHVGAHPNDERIKTIYISDYLREHGYRSEKDRKNLSYPLVLYRDEVLNGRDFMSPGSDPKNPKYDFLEEDKVTDPKKKAIKGLWTNTGYGQMNFHLYPFNGKGVDKNSSDKYYDSNNVILFRNADLLLILADAYNEIGNGAKADEYINLVLNRAKLSNVSGMSKEDRREYIFFERMFELAGEPILFEDIRRRGTEYLRKVIEIHNNSWFENFRYTLETEKDLKSAAEFGTIMINNKNLDENFLKKNLLLPIPQEEIIQNENISQADQNFGYN